MIISSFAHRKYTHLFAILSYIGVMLIFASSVFFLTILTFVFYPEEASQNILCYIIPGFGILSTGIVLLLFLRQFRNGVVRTIDGALIVVCSWTFTCIISAFPIRSVTGLSFIQALFESVSGWTTTGLSMILVEEAPRTFLLYRSILQLAGGAGLAILMLAAVQLPAGVGLYRAEGRNDQLVPNVVRSTKLVLRLYLAYAVVGSVAYRLAGMSWFDSINHSFAAISTGGFSTQANSIAYWNSPLIEGITILLMVLGNLNFLTAWLLFHGKIRSFLRNGEIKVFLTLFSVSVVFLYFTIGLQDYEGSKAVRVAFFEVVTALTTTGFSTVSYIHWQAIGFLLILWLMIIGGGSCSTAGGVKQFRG